MPNHWAPSPELAAKIRADAEWERKKELFRLKELAARKAADNKAVMARLRAEARDRADRAAVRAAAVDPQLGRIYLQGGTEAVKSVTRMRAQERVAGAFGTRPGD